MSDALFALYRYLSQNQHYGNEDNPYNIALRRLDDFLNIQKELEYWGRFISEHGGINWEDAKVIRDRIVEGAKTVLCEANDQSPAKALVDFASTNVNLACTDYQSVLLGLAVLREQQINELKDE